MKTVLHIITVAFLMAALDLAALTPCKNCGVSEGNIIYMCENHHIICSKCARKQDMNEQLHAHLQNSLSEAMGLGKIADSSGMRCTHVNAYDEACGAPMAKVIADNRSPAEKQTRESSRRQTTNRSVSRSESDTQSSVLWEAASKTNSRGYRYSMRREDGGSLYAYIDDDGARKEISGRWFEASALQDSPAIPTGSGMLRIVIQDDLGNGYVLSKVKLSWNGAKVMTLHITEKGQGKIRCQIWTGHWHKRGDEEVEVVFDKVLSAPAEKGKAYVYPVSK